MHFWNKLARRGQQVSRPLAMMPLLVVSAVMLAGCGFLSGPEEPVSTPTREIVQRELIPTWTPTPLLPTDTPEPVLPTPEPATPTPEPVQAEPAVPTDTPAPAMARLTVTGGNAINVRRGPGTSFGIVGTVNNGMSFDIQGKNPAGDWYQFCCVNGEQGWIYGPLVQVDNAQLVAVAQNIPAAPPTNTPAPVVVAPPAPQPQPQPQPQPEQPPAPAPAGDPCASIGGDGCKFRLTSGPRFGDNGGGELHLQLFFIHSGVDGGQPQGSYFIALEKDGQRLPISDSVRSIALQRSEGPLGPYNYEYKLAAGNLPGGNVGGNYLGWVIDGNGERDSQNFSLTIPGGQGHVWFQLDQN